MAALLTTGRTTGLVIDCGYQETTIFPIFDARPLFTYAKSTPMAGKVLSQRLKSMIVASAKIFDSSQPIVSSMLSDDIIEDIQTRFLFVSPFRINHMLQSPPTSRSMSMSKTVSIDSVLLGVPKGSDTESYEKRYHETSAATDVKYHFRRADNNEMTAMTIPGWIRERAAEVLFEGWDEDQPSIADTILAALKALPRDLRGTYINSGFLLIGGCSMLPNFQARLHQDLMLALGEKRYKNDFGDISKRLKFIDSEGRIFPANTRVWVGGSLVGAIKIAGGEILKEKWDGTVPDWSNH